MGPKEWGGNPGGGREWRNDAPGRRNTEQSVESGNEHQNSKNGEQSCLALLRKGCRMDWKEKLDK